jgi:hypothetical protein
MSLTGIDRAVGQIEAEGFLNGCPMAELETVDEI